jgi:hypothetical protein
MGPSAARDDLGAKLWAIYLLFRACSARFLAVKMLRVREMEESYQDLVEVSIVEHEQNMHVQLTTFPTHSHGHILD